MSVIYDKMDVKFIIGDRENPTKSPSPINFSKYPEALRLNYIRTVLINKTVLVLILLCP